MTSRDTAREGIIKIQPEIPASLYHAMLAKIAGQQSVAAYVRSLIERDVRGEPDETAVQE